MAVGARGRGLVARDSFLLTRALEGLVPLDEWARQGAAPAACARVARALGVALSALFRCGAWLPGLSARDVLLSAAEAGVAPEGDACAADLIHVARAARSVDVPMPNRLPGVVLRGLDGGRILPRVELARRVELCARLSREAPGALTERQRAGVLLRALADLPREQVRRAMRSAAVARA